MHASLQAVKKYAQSWIACVTSRLSNFLECYSRLPGLAQTAGQPRQRLGTAWRIEAQPERGFVMRDRVVLARVVVVEQGELKMGQRFS